MKEHRLEVADVFRKYETVYLASYPSSGEQKRALRDLCLCRTSALGGHKNRCELCGHEEIAYCSCRNRHCPKCQGKARAKWLEARSKDLLDIDYFHVVFTLPEPLGPIALQNKRLVYGILFKAVSETLLTIARDPKHLGAEIGFLSVLHTWGQNLLHHPHLHCLVPGGGLALDQTRWISCPKGFFLPVKVLSRLFRGKLLAFLAKAYQQGKLKLAGKLEGLKKKHQWIRFLCLLKRTDWVVYSKPPFGGPEQTLKYLARYTHRVAISNPRLVSLKDDKVTFRIKDYAQGNRKKTITLDAVEFIRRFLLHIFPKGFMHIRPYGFLANRVRSEKLACCRELLRKKEDTRPSPPDATAQGGNTGEPCEDKDPSYCPLCRKGRMVFVEKMDPDRGYFKRNLLSLIPDTS
jgi:hypothetical protein